MANDYKEYHAPVEKCGGLTVYHPPYIKAQKEAEIAKLRELLMCPVSEDWTPYAT